MASEAGKGSGRRPTQISREELESNWDRIFGKKDKSTPTPSKRGEFGGVMQIIEETPSIEKDNHG